MTFLNTDDSQKRLFLQFSAYSNSKHLKLVNHLIDIPIFEIENYRIPSSEFVDFEIPKNLRLGNQLEYFFKFLLKKNKKLELLLSNIQIIENKKTLGELDFIIRDNRLKENIHIEITNKFYLLKPKENEWLEEWIGPNLNDSLFKKIEKLKTKQFPLLHHHATLHYLQEQKIKKPLSQKLNFKAHLFIHLDSNDNLQSTELKDNLSGFYIHSNEFSEDSYSSFSFFMPEKQDWLICPKYCEVWFDFETISKNVEFHLSQNKSPLIWIKKENNEYQRLFVVWW